VSDSSAALARYRAAMRRKRLVYYVIVAVIVIALGTFAGVVWSRGEAAHVTLHTASKAPAALELAGPNQPQHAAWHTTDHSGIGSPAFEGTVITYSAHTVRGRDARTGRTVWSYTRTDRRVCTAAQLSGTTMAIYAVHGNCDEVTALYSDTGKRRWTRTLDKDGVPLNGRPTYQWTPFTLMMTTPSAIYAVDPTSGLDRWTYTRFGCRIERAVLGTAGALISQNCVHPDCSNLIRCGSGPQLLLRDGTAGNGDDSKKDRDQVKWNIIGNRDVPISAGLVVSALNRTTGRLTEYRVDAGKSILSLPLSPAPAPTTLRGVTAAETSEAEIVWLAGVTYALSAGRTTPIWATPTVAAPTVVSTTDTTAALATARFTVPSKSGIAVLDGNSGRVSLRFAVPAPAGGSVVNPLGAGFLVSSSTGSVAYR
jgi:outer membrane protein assembly factor BamB